VQRDAVRCRIAHTPLPLTPNNNNNKNKNNTIVKHKSDLKHIYKNREKNREKKNNNNNQKI
jgi:hypothetical protein